MAAAVRYKAVGRTAHATALAMACESCPHVTGLRRGPRERPQSDTFTVDLKEIGNALERGVWKTSEARRPQYEPCRSLPLRRLLSRL